MDDILERFLAASEHISRSQDARTRVASAMGMSLEEYEARLMEAMGPELHHILVAEVASSG